MIIGLNGLKGSGKDTAGEHLVMNHGFVRASFADLLKESAAVLFGIEPKRWDKLKNDPDALLVFKRKYSEPGLPDATEVIFTQTARGFLQRYGTEAHRDVFGENFWVDALFRKLDRAGFPTYEDIVITDARFDNEIDAIRGRGGKIWQIDRGLPTEDGHRSETLPHPAAIDLVIPNFGTIDELCDQIDAALEGAHV